MDKQNKQPRPHAELIKAWANGETIQYFDPVCGEWADNDNPTWFEANKYRIKPEWLSEPEVGTSYIYVDSDGSVSGAIWEGTNQDRRRLDFGNVFHDMSVVHSAAERVKAALKGEESEEVKKLSRKKEELKKEIAKYEAEIDVLYEEIDEIREALNALSDGEKALIEALRLTPSFEPLWGNFKVLDCEDETLIGLATVAIDTGNYVASPYRIFQALKQIAGEKRNEGGGR